MTVVNWNFAFIKPDVMREDAETKEGFRGGDVTVLSSLPKFKQVLLTELLQVDLSSCAMLPSPGRNIYSNFLDLFLPFVVIMSRVRSEAATEDVSTWHRATRLHLLGEVLQRQSFRSPPSFPVGAFGPVTVLY